MCVQRVKKKCTVAVAAAAMEHQKSQHHYHHYEIYATHSNDPRVERHKAVWLPVRCEMITMHRDHQKSRVSIRAFCVHFRDKLMKIARRQRTIVCQHR